MRRKTESLLTWKPMISTRLQLSEPPLVSQPVPPSPLPQQRIYGKREAAVVHERSVRPRTEFPEEDELFVSSQLQSFRQHVQEHVSDQGVESILKLTLSLRIL